MIIVGPLERVIEVSVPIGDSRRTVGEYRENAVEVAHALAEREGYPVVDTETFWEPEKRRVRAFVTVEVHDFFEDEECL